MIYRARQLVHAYGGRKVLGPCKFTVREGSRFAVVGPNGSGKTTLAEILVGLMPQVSGELRFCDEPMRLPLERRLRGRIGYVAQQPFPLPGTVGGNLELAARAAGRQSAGAPCVRDTAAAIGIGDLLERSERTLSVGQLRMAALARAVIRRAPVLVLDEPFAFVDDRYRESIVRALEGHASTGGTVVMTSPRISEISGWADEVLDLSVPPAPGRVTRLHGAV